MNELNVFLKALESLKIEEGTYIPRTLYTPTRVNAIKNYRIDLYLLNKGNKKLIASANHNYNVTDKNHNELYIDIIAQTLKYYGIE